MTTTLLPAEHAALTTTTKQVHVLPHALIPAEEPFEAWEDGAYVLAYLRQNGLC